MSYHRFDPDITLYRFRGTQFKMDGITADQAFEILCAPENEEMLQKIIKNYRSRKIHLPEYITDNVVSWKRDLNSRREGKEIIAVPNSERCIDYNGPGQTNYDAIKKLQRNPKNPETWVMKVTIEGNEENRSNISDFLNSGDIGLVTETPYCNRLAGIKEECEHLYEKLMEDNAKIGAKNTEEFQKVVDFINNNPYFKVIRSLDYSLNEILDYTNEPSPVPDEWYKNGYEWTILTTWDSTFAYAIRMCCSDRQVLI